MAKSKYTPDRVERILEAIARDGLDRSGWLAGGINKDTFYGWQNQYPEFSVSVARAKAQFKAICPEELTNVAREKLANALEGQVIRRRSNTTKRIDHFDGDGNLVWYQIHTEEGDKSEQMPPPKWAIEHVLPKPLNSLEQIMAAASEYGCTLVIKDVDLFNRYLAECQGQGSQGSFKSGLTDAEAAELRAKILGLAED